MKTVLTAKGVEAARTDRAQLDIYNVLVPGLALRVGRGGTKTWLVRYRASGRYRRLKLGRYPTLSLAKAREKARDKLVVVSDGGDPAAEAKVLRSDEATFRALTDEVLKAKGAGWRDATRTERTRIINTELIPVWGSRPAASIGRRDVVLLLDRIEERGATVMRNRVLATIKMVFNVGIRRGFPGVEANPAALLDPLAEGGRDRFLTPDRDQDRVEGDGMGDARHAGHLPARAAHRATGRVVCVRSAGRTSTTPTYGTSRQSPSRASAPIWSRCPARRET